MRAFFVMEQIYSNYTSEDQLVWKTLFDRQVVNLEKKGDPSYLQCLDTLSDYLNATSIPDFKQVNQRLGNLNGWQITVVPGLIPVEDFFSLLAEKKWCSSTWLRPMKQLDYLEEPDMFHDIFGHLPLLADPVFSKFMESFGKLGVRFMDSPSALTCLQRLYWFTVEFGVTGRLDAPLLYGAGIMSSYGESNHIYSDSVTIHPFDLEKVINHSFVNSEIQAEYYHVESYQQLYDAIGELGDLLEQGIEVTPDIIR